MTNDPVALAGAIITGITIATLAIVLVVAILRYLSPQRRFEREFKRLLDRDHIAHVAEQANLAPDAPDRPWRPNTQTIQHQAWVNTMERKR